MRLKEDDSSWNASGIKRRDFRHSHGDPEVDTSKVKSKKKPRKRIDHKHVWVEEVRAPLTRWEREQNLYWLDPDWPRYRIIFHCEVKGCDARKYRKNPRYRYENYKWRKKNRGR